MSEVRHRDLEQLHQAGADLGNFYPTHHVFIAFAGRQHALAARAALLDEGFEAEDCRYFDDRQVAEASRHGIEQANILAAVGKSLEMVKLHERLAEQGCHFLLVRADSDTATARLMQVAHRWPVKLAQKYHPLVIETLD